MKLGRASWNSSDEKVKDKNSTNLITEKADLKSTLKENNMSESSEIKEWPSVFVLQPHPTHPVICYAGKSLNINKKISNDLEISSINTTNDTNSSTRSTKQFVLSSDPQYPVICQEVYTPPLSVNNGSTVEENVTISNITCIRRDYENDISAIFLNKVGPIQSAWNIFNSTIAYDMHNVKNIDSVGEIRMLNETIVGCVEYGVIDDDRRLNNRTIASLLGVG
ncbi:uncharacterized protein [Halyomorpha halys]|nr:uncharacterized protein LOC106679225 [Halyomorpha halys]